MDLLERVLDKIEKIEEKLSSMDKCLERQTVTMEEHVKRCNLLEAELKPVKKHVLMVESIFKFIGGISVLAGLIYEIMEILRH